MERVRRFGSLCGLTWNENALGKKKDCRKVCDAVIVFLFVKFTENFTAHSVGEDGYNILKD